MLAALLPALLCAAPDLSVSADPLVPAEVYEAPAAPDRPRRYELFVAPLATGAGAAAGVFAIGGLYLPTGATFAMGPHWGLTTELAVGLPVMRQGRIENPGWAISTAVGPTFFWRDSGFEGFFVTPKVVFQIASPATSTAIPLDIGGGPPLDVGPGISRTFLGALDVGYRWRWRSVSLSVVTGAGIGYGWDLHDSLVSPLPFGRGFNREGQVAYQLDADLLRLGFTF